MEKTAAFFTADACLLLLSDEAGQVTVAASTGVNPKTKGAFSSPLDERIPQALLEWLGFDPDNHFLGVPVVHHRQIRGILAVVCHGPGRVTADEEFLLSALADQAAIALEHAARYRTARGDVKAGEQWLRVAVDAGEIGVWEWDIESDRVTCSERVYEFHGLQPDTLVSTAKQFAELVHPEDRARVSEAMQQALDLGTPYRLEFRTIRPDGEVRWLSTNARLYRDEDGRLLRLLGATQDATDRKRLEHQLRETASALAEANRRKDEFLATLGHELRNPLAAISNANFRLAQAPLPDPLVERLFGHIEHQTRHLTRLVDDLLDVARVTQGKLELRREAVELAPIIKQAADSVRSLIERRGHSLLLQTLPEPIWLHADAARLEQIFTSLLTNAIHFTEPGGKIWLTTERAESEVLLRVRDTGVGIPSELQPRIFELFTQANLPGESPDKGLGVGLHLVKWLVELHGGTVTACCEGLGRGSEFLVTLPALPSAPPCATLAGEADPSNRHPHRRILVVEDNLASAETLVEILEHWGHVVRHLPDGVLATLTALEFQPDVVLLDIGMPGPDGYEVARRLRQDSRLQGLVIIALTGYGLEEDRRRTAAAGFSHHVTKPVDFDVLQELICG